MCAVKRGHAPPLLRFVTRGTLNYKVYIPYTYPAKNCVVSVAAEKLRKSAPLTDSEAEKAEATEQPTNSPTLNTELNFRHLDNFFNSTHSRQNNSIFTHWNLR